MTQEQKLEAIHSALVGTLEKPGLLDDIREMKRSQQIASEQTTMFRRELSEQLDGIKKHASSNTERIVSLEGFRNKAAAMATGAGLAAGSGATWLAKFFGLGGNNH